MCREIKVGKEHLLLSSGNGQTQSPQQISEAVFPVSTSRNSFRNPDGVEKSPIYCAVVVFQALDILNVWSRA